MSNSSATVEALLDRVQSTGCFVVEARTPPSFEGELPPQLKACPHELPLSDAVAYLKPLPPSQEGAPRTAVEFVCAVDRARTTDMRGALASQRREKAAARAARGAARRATSEGGGFCSCARARRRMLPPAGEHTTQHRTRA